MASPIPRILEMLAGEDAELACAAARVLGELGDRSAPVLRALEKLLASPNSACKQYALTALGRLGLAESVAAVLPLLKEPDPLRKAATDALAALGPDALPAFDAPLAGADAALKLPLLGVLARMRSKESLSALFERFFDPEVEVIKRAADAVRERTEAMTDKERADLAARAEKFLGQAKVKKDERARVCALKALGAARRPESAGVLLDHTDPAQPTGVRLNALTALARLPVEPEAPAPGFARLLPLLSEPDFPNIVANALAVLQRWPPDKTTQKALLALCESPHGAVRVFAIRALGVLGGDKAAAALVPLVGGADRRLSDEAAAALRGNVDFLAGTVAALGAADSVERAWALAGVVRAHKPAVPKAAVTAFLKQTIKLLDAGDERWKPLFEMLRDVALEPLRAAVLERGRKVRKEGELARAESLFRLLDRDDMTDPESRYELGVALLLQSSADLSRPGSDPRSPIPHFSVLVRAGSLAVGKRLKSEKPPLGPAEFLYLGFHFTERVGPERELGGELLRHVVEKFGRSAEAKVAKQKLRTEGLGE
ncbi:MAG: HEAT repeat domain-containing protein [Planctomycetes bacterium]|nr:HEAT repeat domain-containing protein [Planctomycetota bacterium]